MTGPFWYDRPGFEGYLGMSGKTARRRSIGWDGGNLACLRSRDIGMRSDPMRRPLAALSVLFAVLMSAPEPAAAQAGELAFVQPDGTLKLSNRRIRLYGIHIPPTDRFCRTYLRPIQVRYRPPARGAPCW